MKYIKIHLKNILTSTHKYNIDGIVKRQHLTNPVITAETAQMNFNEMREWLLKFKCDLNSIDSYCSTFFQL